MKLLGFIDLSFFSLCRFCRPFGPCPDLRILSPLRGLHGCLSACEARRSRLRLCRAAASTLKGEACSNYERNPDRARRPCRLRGKNVGEGAACGRNLLTDTRNRTAWLDVAGWSSFARRTAEGGCPHMSSKKRLFHMSCKIERSTPEPLLHCRFLIN